MSRTDLKDLQREAWPIPQGVELQLDRATGQLRAVIISPPGEPNPYQANVEATK